MKKKKLFKDTAVGGFLAKAAPAVIDLVGDVFPPAKILGALISSDPSMTNEQKARAQQLLQSYELEVMRIENADRDSARDMQKAALAQDDKFSKRFAYYLAAFSVLVGFAYVFCITFMTIPEGAQRFADTILGVVIGVVFGTIYNFFFGSSTGSKIKDNNILKIKTDDKE